jgi:hypothetical protein
VNFVSNTPSNSGVEINRTPFYRRGLLEERKIFEVVFAIRKEH